VTTSITDHLAATRHHSTLSLVKRQWQKADWAVPEVAAFRLRKEKFITQFSPPLLAHCFMKRPVIPLTCDAAITNELAIGITCRQFDVINDTTGSTAQRLACFSTCRVAAAALLSIVDHHITALGIECGLLVETEAEPRACMQ
jgi:hypothetical protein